MDDREEDDSRYPPNPYSSNRHKVPARNSSYNDEEEEEEEDGDDDEQVGEEELGEEEEEDEEVNGSELVIGETNQEEEDDNDNDDDDDDEDGIDDGIAFYRNKEVDNDERHRKKRKLKSLAYGYEFAPRIAAAATPPSVTGSKPQSFGIGSGGRNSPADWSEHATFVLLDAWGDRFLQLGRKSLRSEEWVEVAKKVSHGSKQVRTDTQCRNRLDTLKKKYKKEKMMLAETGESSSKWTFFKKMDILLSSSSSSRQPPGLSCGLDSGEYVFMNPKSYLNRSNGLDEMRDSPGNSESSEGIGDDSDGLPPKRTRSVETEHGGSSFRLLADSIKKFGEIYEKIENSKRQQMVELEKMRMDFHRDLELQKRQIMERAHAEIAKIRQGDDEEIDVSTENTSG